MDVSIPLWLLIAVAILILVAGAAAIWRTRRPPAAVEVMVKPPPKPDLTSLSGRLEHLQASGQWDELLRLLDRTLPEWPTSSSLIEVARATAALDRELAKAPSGAVSDVVTARLSRQVGEVTRDLWVLAARLDHAATRGSPELRRELEREDEVLLRLLPAIREARAEVAELRLAAGPGTSLDRAEGRFRSLAATARELRELEENATVR